MTNWSIRTDPIVGALNNKLGFQFTIEVAFGEFANLVLIIDVNETAEPFPKLEIEAGFG